jgi:poly(3-hydroxybutyrate) depolymerase
MVDASSECQPSHATSVMIFNGTNDYSRPYNGIAGYMMSVDQTVAYWSQYNNTDSSPQTNIIGDIENYTYLNGDNNTIVDLFKIVNGDHYWFNLSYNGNSMEELMWNFFSSN